MKPSKLGQRILTTRQRQHITREKLAAKAGVSVSTLQAIETGISKSMNTFTLAAVAKALGVSVEYLQEGVGE